MPSPLAENKQLSLLIIAHSFRSERIGGVECYTYNLAKEMEAKGVSVTVLHPVSYSGIQDYFFDSGLYNGLRVVKFHVPFRDFIATVSPRQMDYSFESFLKQNRFDLVHFHHTLYFSMTMPGVVSNAGIPVAMTLHDFWFICPRIFLYNEKNNQVCSGPEQAEKCVACYADSEVNYEKINSFLTLRQEIGREQLAKMDLLYSPSAFVARIYSRTSFGAGKIQVSPLGTQKIQPKAKKASQHLRFAFLGTINPVKNVINLIHAFSCTSGLATLEILGGGEPRHINNMLESIQDSRIRYYGKFTPEDLQDIFAEIDILVLPSWIETYSLILREALSADIPVIASNVGGIPEIVIDGVNGFLFDPADNEQLTRIMQRIIDDRTIFLQLKPGKVQIPSIAEDAERLITDYLRLIGRRQSAGGGTPA